MKAIVYDIRSIVAPVAITVETAIIDGQLKAVAQTGHPHDHPLLIAPGESATLRIDNHGEFVSATLSAERPDKSL